MAVAARSILWCQPGVQAAPGPLPRPPNRSPAAPIMIRTPPPRRDELEIIGPDDEWDDREIRQPTPDWVPDLPPPARPEERAARGWH
jgi:hypothetical protein